MAEKTFDISEEEFLISRSTYRDLKHRVIDRNEIGMVQERAVGTDFLRIRAFLELAVIEEWIWALRAKQEDIG